jgi:hypothetical protein
MNERVMSERVMSTSIQASSMRGVQASLSTSHEVRPSSAEKREPSTEMT